MLLSTVVHTLPLKYNGRIVSLLVGKSPSRRFCSGKPPPRSSTRYDCVEARTVEFTPSRARDISSATVCLQERSDQFGEPAASAVTDEHLDSYDSHGTISLSSVMQTTVPEPFTGRASGTPTHLNMPGGHVNQNQKYLSGNLQSAHYVRTARGGYASPTNEGTSCGGRRVDIRLILNRILYSHCCCRNPLLTHSLKHNPVLLCTSVRPFFKRASDSQPPKKLSQRQKLRKAIKEYGITILVFHIVLSLLSLGGIYLAISSGMNLFKLLDFLSLEHGMINRKLTSGASTFVIAYAVHKVFAPARIAITLAAAPFLVRYLRKLKILKTPKR